MAQDVDETGLQPPAATQDGDPRRRRSPWAWILLLIVVLVVIILLWLYWRTPQKATVTIINKTTEIPVVPEPRPEPTLPSVPASATSSETASTRLVPDVLGDSKSSAVNTLNSAGYAVSTSQRYTTSKASGFVIEQTPGGGTALEPGRTVAITVAIGTPAVNDVTMPNVVGLTQSSAEAKIKAVGMVPTVLYGVAGTTPGMVFSQWPAAGDSIPAGSEGFIQIQMSQP